MDINFICSRKRKEFGKPCIFTDNGPNIFCEIDPNREKRDDFVRIERVDRQIDNSVKMCAQELNTTTYPTENRGMNHLEGGWPASVDSADEESMTRFRKKIDKDKSYSNTVKSLGEFLENFIMENNSVDIYEEYFEGQRITKVTNWSISAASIFQDVDATYRSVIDLCWDESSSKFATVYGLKENNEYPPMPCYHSYVWDVGDNVKPFCVLQPEVPMTVAVFSPTDSNVILGGYVSGQVALWDVRASGYAQQLSSATSSHGDKVTGIKWLMSKDDTTFFSASCDGTLIAWDTRNLSSFTEIVHLDPEERDFPNLDQKYAISCLEYDASIPDKFMIGTEQGVVLSFNRKFKDDEDKFGSRYDCKCGPLLNLERNVFYPQIFASCDAWFFKLWSDEVTETPVLNIATQDGYFTDIAWNPTRPSTIYATKTNGILEVWDLPGKIKEPLQSIKLDNEPLLSVSAAHSGKHIICGTLSGSVQLLNIPEYLQTCSDLENDLLKECIKESSEVTGGSPRLERILEHIAEFSVDGVDEDYYDPPEKAEDLYEEHRRLFERFVTEDE